MKKLSFIILAGVVVVASLQQTASGQQQAVQRFVYDTCAWFQDEVGWWRFCEVRIDDGGPTISIPWGEMPAWSPDGVRVVFARNGIEAFNRADGSIVTLSNAGSSPRWSPDGARIAFIGSVASPDGPRQGLLVMNADGSNPTLLADSVRSFAWAPNGATIAFGRYVDATWDLHLTNADGTNSRRLTYGVGFGGGVSWSPDSSRIVFNCNTNVCAINPLGTDLVQLIASAADAIYSPAGGKIAFLTGSWELAVMEANGRVVRVAPGILASQPTWSPDGGSLAFVKLVLAGGGCNGDGSPCDPEDEIHVVNADGTGLRFLDYGYHPAWFIPQPGQPTAAFTYECTGAACQFDAASSFDPNGTIASYLWKFGDGNTSSERAPAHTYATARSYDVTLIVTDEGGTIDVTRSRVMANTPPVASFTVACDGPICTFNASGSSDADGTIANYYWTFGDGSDDVWQAGPLVTHTYPTGRFTASLSVIDSGGGGSGPVSGAAITVVNAPPVASFAVTCTYLFCAADGSASSDPDGTFLWFTWNFGQGESTGHGSTESYRYGTAGTYTITLTVADAFHQTNSTTKTVTVIAPPPPTMHVGDLEAWSDTLRSTWNAFAQVEIHTENHSGPSGVTVFGVWDDGTAAACTTEWYGRCVFSRYGLRKTNAVTLTVTGASYREFVYKAADNHDPDGDSNGTTVTVRRR